MKLSRRIQGRMDDTMSSIVMSRLLDCPREVQDHILKCLLDTIQNETNPATNPVLRVALPFALTCKILYGIAYPYLYKHLNLNVPTSGLLRCAQEASKWGQHVRSVNVRFCPPQTYPLAYTRQYLLESILRCKLLRDIVTKLPFLNSIYFDFEEQMPDRFNISPPSSPAPPPAYDEEPTTAIRPRSPPFRLQLEHPRNQQIHNFNISFQRFVDFLYRNGQDSTDEFNIFSAGVSSVLDSFVCDPKKLFYIEMNHRTQFDDDDAFRQAAIERFYNRFCHYSTQVIMRENRSGVEDIDAEITESRVPLTAGKVVLVGHSFIEKDFAVVPSSNPCVIAHFSLYSCELDFIGLRLMLSHLAPTIHTICLKDISLLTPSTRISFAANSMNSLHNPNRILQRLGDVLIPKVYIQTFRGQGLLDFPHLEHLDINIVDDMPWKMDISDPRDQSRRMIACQQAVLHSFSRAFKLRQLIFDAARMDALCNSFEGGIFKGLQWLQFGPVGSTWRGSVERTMEAAKMVNVNEEDHVKVLDRLGRRVETVFSNKRILIQEENRALVERHEKVDVEWNHDLPDEVMDEIGHLFVDPNLPSIEGTDPPQA
ncbi:hypothetical protein BT69DRAFT_1315632 [Atractiella rhizophila]|nr:hypothetical protein BT69DRAFT_1315632 [Atractiella rhizophila]